MSDLQIRRCEDLICDLHNFILSSHTHTVFLWSRARVINAAFVKGVTHSALSVCVRVSLRADVPGNAARLTGMVSWNEESWMKPNHTGSPSRRVCVSVCARLVVLFRHEETSKLNAA